MRKQIGIAALVVSALLLSIDTTGQSTLYKEKYRPQFHFTPAIHWTNDPNGLVFNNGTYHLFYQYNPMANRWGHMSWGHAVSKDLVNWNHWPVAIEEGKDVMIFSGSCVVDVNNTSGFGKDGKTPMVAVYTGHKQDGSHQSQHLAYSLDDGVTWTKYANNPVLDLNKRDFRDPKVFWYEPEKKWVMVVAFPNERQLEFYSSTTLKEWKHMSSFGPAGDASGIWECPDLFETPIADQPGKTKWVLMHSPAPYMQYFVGDFDGTKFTAENDTKKIFRPDYGPDYYAAITYNNLGKGAAPISIGWVSNPSYAGDLPTFPWKCGMSLPRKLSLKKFGDEWLMVQKPVDNIALLRGESIQWQNTVLKGSRIVPVKSQQFEMDLILDMGTATECAVLVAAGTDHEMKIGYNSATKKLFIDRSKTSNQSFHDNFKKSSRYETDLNLSSKRLQLHIFFDNSLVEVFADQGEVVMTAQIFPDAEDKGIELTSNGNSLILAMNLWKMKSAW